MRVSVLLAGVALSTATIAAPAIAADTSATVAKSAPLPAQLGPNARTQYRAIFDDIDASRWAEALAAGVAPPVVLESTHASALKFVSIAQLEKHRLSGAVQ